MNVGSLTWEVARTGGFVAYGLLTASVAFGLALSLGWKGRRWTRFVTNEVHRFITLLALAFTGVHTLAVAVDPFIRMSPPDVLVPFVGSYRPIWVSAGIVATYLLVAVYLSERVRSRIGYAWWRRFHGIAFVAFLLTVVHGIGTGSDTRSVFAMAIYGGSIALVGGLIGLRVFPAAPKPSKPWGAAITVASAVAILAFAAVGPLAPGWSVRAGGKLPNAVAAADSSGGKAGVASTGSSSAGASTGSSDGTGTGAGAGSGAASGTGSADGGAAPSGHNAAGNPPARAGIGGLDLNRPLPFTGRIGRVGGVGADDDGGGDDGGGGAPAGLLIQARLTDGTAALQVQIVPTQGGSATGQLVLQTGDGSTCQGPVTDLSNSRLTATCADASGSSWAVSLDLTTVTRRSIVGTLTLAAGGPASSGSGPGSAGPGPGASGSGGSSGAGSGSPAPGGGTNGEGSST